MAAPNTVTVLYVIPSQHLQTVADQSATSQPSEIRMDSRAEELIAALRAGRPVQAMTTLKNGDVLFALGMTGT